MNAIMHPWHPMRRSIDLKHLGKLAEESSELCSAAARCIIQGIDEANPDTGKINRAWLEEEIADVEANIALCKRHFSLDMSRINVRRERKYALLLTWHEMA